MRRTFAIRLAWAILAGGCWVSAWAQAPRRPEHVKVVELKIRPGRMTPGTLTVPAGRYFLAVENRAGTGNISVRVDREGAGRVAEPRIPVTQRRWIGLVTLAPGRYVVSANNHGPWRCEITVSPGP